MKDGKEFIFRFYFVDTPEAEISYPERTADQSAYFGIAPKRTLVLGKEATAFTANALKQPFTVQTRWRLALGRSKLPRYYAVIVTASGEDLAEMLVKAGLARIYGTRTPLPDGLDSKTYLRELGNLENEAKLAKRGGWNSN